MYVFALQTQQDPNRYDPLRIDQWEFYVLPVADVVALGQRTVGLSKLSNPVMVSALPHAVRAAAGA